MIEFVSQKEERSNSSENEFELLQNFIDNLMTDKELMKKDVKKKEKIVLHNYLSGLLQGHIRKSSPDVKFLSDKFAVAILDVKNCDELFCDEIMSEKERFETTHFIISNIMEETVGKHHLCYIVEHNGFFVAIVSISADRSEPEKDIVDALNVGKLAITDNFSLILSIVTGNVHIGIEGISQSYKEAYEAFECVQLTGDADGVVEYKSLFSNAVESEGEYYYPAEKEAQLISSIKMGSYNVAKEILDEIFEVNSANYKITSSIFRCLTIDIANTFLKFAADNDTKGFIADIFNYNDKIKMKELVFVAAEKLCAQDDFSSKGIDSGVDEKIKMYILENYKDPNLCIQSLGEHFKMQGYYLSKIFKNATGSGIAEYIRHIRIDAARKIIDENPQLKLENVAQMAGFPNARSLTRAFKQEYGIVPGKYRDNLE